MPRLIRGVLEEAGIEGAERASTGVDLVGDVAILRLERLSAAEKRRVANALLGALKNVRVVVEQLGGIEGEYRLRRLKHVAGEKRTLTLHRENGCSFRVDVAECYFSPRLSTERLRVATSVRPEESVLNMFAGVGPFSIPIARLKGARVMSCELNEYASELHAENNALNRVGGLVELVNADAMELPRLTRRRFDRVLMPHPSEADRFLPTALRKATKGATVHYYRHDLGRNEEEAAGALREELAGLLPARVRYSVRKVREVGPRWVEMVAEIRAPG